LQKQGNVCFLTGLIRRAMVKIDRGAPSDINKDFWHAEMETLIQTGESALDASDKVKQWGELATIGPACRPNYDIELLANNHASTSKITVTKDGSISWKSGGERHGWISLSGVVWKAGGELEGNMDAPNLIASIDQKPVAFSNGWEGESTAAYKQGNVCFILGDCKSGRNFDGTIMTLPTVCRPPVRMMFPFAHGERTFRIDVRPDGGVEPKDVPADVEKHLNLQSLIFPTEEGEELDLNAAGNWGTTKEYPLPMAFRQGAMCILSGVAVNSDIRGGVHSLLQASGKPATLPEWCLPRNRMAFTTISTTGKAVRIDVMPDGEVRWIAGFREKYLNFVGIKFEVRADIVQKFSKNLLKVSECE